MFDFDDDTAPLAFPDMLLEPPPAWDDVGLIALHDYERVAAEMAHRADCEEDDLAPECRLRRHELHSLIGEHEIYLHRSGGLIQPNVMAVAVYQATSLKTSTTPTKQSKCSSASTMHVRLD